MKNESSLVSGAAFGVAIGAVIGILTDDLALWISLGIVLGAGIGLTERTPVPTENRVSESETACCNCLLPL